MNAATMGVFRSAKGRSLAERETTNATAHTDEVRPGFRLGELLAVGALTGSLLPAVQQSRRAPGETQESVGDL